jgi:hypothetical protein
VKQLFYDENARTTTVAFARPQIQFNHPLSKYVTTGIAVYDKRNKKKRLVAISIA